MLKLPLWIVTEHIKPTDPEHILENQPGTVLAFSSLEKLISFKQANKGGEWKMESADDREGLVVVIADLHRLNIESIILDPEEDGTSGQSVSLADLVAFSNSLGS